MSPVIPHFFAATKSIPDVQFLQHMNGVCVYVVKCIGKKDEGNRVLDMANTLITVIRT